MLVKLMKLCAIMGEPAEMLMKPMKLCAIMGEPAGSGNDWSCQHDVA